MLKPLKTIGIVTVIAVTIWLFAEAESLGDATLIARIQFVAGEGQDRLVRTVEGTDPTVAIDVRGSRGGIGRARDALTEGIRLELGSPGVASTDGRHTVNLLNALLAYKPLSGQGLKVVSVRPQNVDIIVRELVTIQVPIEPRLDGAEAVGPVKVTPETAQIRMPRSAWQSMGERLRAPARLSEEQASRLPGGGVARVDVRVEKPPELAGVDDVTLLTNPATLEFTVKNRAATLTVPVVPVQLVIPPIETERWAVRIQPEDQILSAEVSGPSEIIERIKGPAERLIAVLALSSDELESGVSSKEVSFALLRGGALAPLPESLRLTPSKAVVRFTVERRQEP